MRDWIIIAVASIVAGVCGFYSHRIGYDQGRNDGFKAGWREAMEAKELPEPPAEDE